MSPTRTTGRRRLEIAAVVLLFAVGAALRLWRLDLGWFGVDQARDVQTGLDIAAGRDWPLVGPTMRRVTSLGALYYYFWSLPFLVSADPLAAYRFAALLGIVAVGLTWWLARRHFGPLAALVSLAALATCPVAIIDGRVAWAPAALPVVAVLVLWSLTTLPEQGARRPSGATRFLALGALLGLAVQLHLTMVAWVAAATVVVVLRRPGRRALVATGAGFAVIALPAAYAVLANAGHDAGVPSLASRGELPNLAVRLFAAVAVAWRVPPAFWQWQEGPAWPPAAWRLAGLISAVLAMLGVLRLLADATRGRPVARDLLVVLVCQLGVVAALPGEVWYYYLDATLPLSALLAGALCAGSAPRPVGAIAAFGVLAAALVPSAAATLWLRDVAAYGHLVLDPAPLTLDGTGGRDAAVRGKLVTAGVKRAVAAAVAVEPAPFAERWLATHGPAFDDVTGDNGFWLARASVPSAPPAALTHAALWYRDDPTAPHTPTCGFTLADVGPFVLARYQPAILYDRCRDGDGPIRVPVRIVPDPRRYGDGTIARPTTLPPRVECAVAGGRGAVRVVAAIGAGTVTLTGPDGAPGPTDRVSTLCIARGEAPVPFTITLVPPDGASTELDLYEQPDPRCARE